MQDTVNLTGSSAGLFPNPDTGSFWILINGVSSFSYPLVTTLFNVQSVTTKWSFWNSTTIISLFLFLNYTKGQWQNIIAAPVADVLDFIFRLSHTENINRLEAYNGFKIRRGTQAKIYQKSSGRHDSCAG